VLETSADELRALAAARAGQPRHLVALDYLLATTTAQIDWLRRFIGDLRPRAHGVPT
jgi:hypothetical protein